VNHYNAARPHRGIELRTPEQSGATPMAKTAPQVRRREILGGLINEYSKAA
jgi:hypothetical protein